MSDTSSSSKKSTRNCPTCRVRMSSHDLDAHVLCVTCRGKSCCMNDRCEICVDWSDDRMNAYLKHQASLERKRRSKSKQKSKKEESIPDLSTICTGMQGSGDVSDEGATRGGAGVDSASSTAGSASRQEVEDIVSEKFFELGQQLRSSISSDVGMQLNQFG